MSWSNGSQIFSEIIHSLRDSVPEFETRLEIYKQLIQVFEDNDCDTLYECMDEDNAFDEAYLELHPDDEDEEEDYDEYDDEELDEED